MFSQVKLYEPLLIFSIRSHDNLPLVFDFPCTVFNEIFDHKSQPIGIFSEKDRHVLEANIKDAMIKSAFIVISAKIWKYICHSFRINETIEYIETQRLQTSRNNKHISNGQTVFPLLTCRVEADGIVSSPGSVY